jgi:L-threonylcarbamoyladenylate synthase
MDRAVAVLAGGGLVALPTDTVYGLAAHAFLPEAVARLYAVKERPLSLPIALLLPDAEAMTQVCAAIPLLAWTLAMRFWPGALSLVLRKRAVVPDLVTSGGSTVAVRVPGHPLVPELCRQLGAPLAATSANLHGQQPSTTAKEVLGGLGGRVDLILDGGDSPGGMASTVLDLTVFPPAILRSGPISERELDTVISFRP